METKICNDCGRELPITEFYQYVDKRTNKAMIYAKCRKCESERRSVLYKKAKVMPKPKLKAGENTKEIDRINCEAVNSGMTYGQYVAKMYVERERKLRERT